MIDYREFIFYTREPADYVETNAYLNNKRYFIIKDSQNRVSKINILKMFSKNKEETAISGKMNLLLSK